MTFKEFDLELLQEAIEEREENPETYSLPEDEFDKESENVMPEDI